MFNPLQHASEPWVLYIDESYQDNVMTIGAVGLPSSRVADVVQAWHLLKSETFGVAVDLELKSSYGGKEPAREVLDGLGWTHAKRVPAMLDVISAMPLVVLGNTIVDRRSDFDIVDRYHENLQWCIRRFANLLEIDLRSRAVGHRVVIDVPPTPSELTERSVGPMLRDFVENHRGRIPFEAYRRMQFEGEQFPGTLRRGKALSRLGFDPELLCSHARTSDMLQVADLVSGTIRAFVSANLHSTSTKTYIVENFKRIAPLIRAGVKRGTVGRTIHTFGFDVFDPQRPWDAPRPVDLAVNLAAVTAATSAA